MVRLEASRYKRTGLFYPDGSFSDVLSLGLYREGDSAAVEFEAGDGQLNKTSAEHVDR